jgi:thiamine pyrophosphate-dependent acetolactate synthase large subunit-like protein
MKTNKNTMSKIAQINKEELSKVELSIVGDANKAVNDLKGKVKRLKDVQEEFAEAKMKTIRAKQQAEKAASLKSPFVGGFSINPYQVMNDMKAAAKELGVDVKKIDGYGELNNFIQDYELQLRKAEEAKSQLNKEL